MAAVGAASAITNEVAAATLHARDHRAHAQTVIHVHRGEGGTQAARPGAAGRLSVPRSASARRRSAQRSDPAFSVQGSAAAVRPSRAESRPLRLLTCRHLSRGVSPAESPSTDSLSDCRDSATLPGRTRLWSRPGTPAGRPEGTAPPPTQGSQPLSLPESSHWPVPARRQGTADGPCVLVEPAAQVTRRR